MNYTITPSSDGKFIVVRVRGNITRQIAMQFNVEAHALGRQLGIIRYLVDATGARNTETTIDNYEFAYSDMRNTEGIDHSARVAALVDPNDHSHDFIETVSRNAGQNVRIFRDHDQAMRFLMGDEGQPIWDSAQEIE